MELTIREGDLVYNVHEVGIDDWLKVRTHTVRRPVTMRVVSQLR
jgi:hypothetical protein